MPGWPRPSRDGRSITPCAIFGRGITDPLVADADGLARDRAGALADPEAEAYRLNKRMRREPACEAAVAKGQALASDAPTRNVFASLRR
ncbi:MAG: hypothetical protein AAGC67_15135 [Myxococcota bacterium]